MPTSDRLAAAALLLVAGCGERSPEPVAQTGPTIPTPEVAAPDTRIACAHGDAPLAQACTVEQQGGKDGPVLTVRNADGGFHRFTVLADGTGVAAADGAEPARVAIVGNEIEVAIGDDRYRLPAQIGAARP